MRSLTQIIGGRFLSVTPLETISSKLISIRGELRTGRRLFFRRNDSNETNSFVLL